MEEKHPSFLIEQPRFNLINSILENSSRNNTLIPALLDDIILYKPQVAQKIYFRS
jgi:hypothetical protein